MPKLNLLEILKNTIVEQPGLYSRQELEKAKEESITNPDPTNVDPIDVRKDFEDIYIDYSGTEPEVKQNITYSKDDLKKLLLEKILISSMKYH